jgi:hypothetical protein
LLASVWHLRHTEDYSTVERLELMREMATFVENKIRSFLLTSDQG